MVPPLPVIPPQLSNKCSGAIPSVHSKPITTSLASSETRFTRLPTFPSLLATCTATKTTTPPMPSSTTGHNGMSWPILWPNIISPTLPQAFPHTRPQWTSVSTPIDGNYGPLQPNRLWSMIRPQLFHHHCTMAAVRSIWLQKRSLPPHSAPDLDWQGISAAMHASPLRRCRWIVKFNSEQCGRCGLDTLSMEGK